MIFVAHIFFLFSRKCVNWCIYNLHTKN